MILLCRTSADRGDRRQAARHVAAHRGPARARREDHADRLHRRHRRFLRGRARRRVRARRPVARRAWAPAGRRTRRSWRSSGAAPIVGSAPTSWWRSSSASTRPTTRSRRRRRPARVRRRHLLGALQPDALGGAVDRHGAAVDRGLVGEGDGYALRAGRAQRGARAGRLRTVAAGAIGCSNGSWRRRHSPHPSFTIRGGTNEILRSVAAKGLQPTGTRR